MSVKTVKQSKIKMGGKYKEIQSFVKENSGWNLSRVKLISYLICGILKLHTVSLVKLSKSIESNAQLSSNYRRIQKFFSKFDINYDIISMMIFKLLPEQSSYKIAMDRTNWKFGKLDINILMLSCCLNGISIPIIWVLLPKRGNSNYEERKKIIDKYIELFGKESISVFLADREFIGQKWFKYLLEEQIPFCIRIKNNTIVKRAGKKIIRADQLFHMDEYDKCHSLAKPVIIGRLLLFISGIKRYNKETKETEHIIILTNKRLDNAAETYKHRWQIETMFKAFKSSGFNLEETHLIHLKRIKKLIAILSLAFVWAYIVGEIENKVKPIRIKSHGRKQYTIFKYGLMNITYALLNTFYFKRFEVYKKIWSCT